MGKIDVEDLQGSAPNQYFANRKPKTSNEASYDQDKATRLWQVSAALVGLPTPV
jgi:hypothetical protein